jgi:ribosomal protein S18 acetylase RimI-like enzyme
MSLVVAEANLQDLNELILVAKAAYVETYLPLGDKPPELVHLFAEQEFTREKFIQGLAREGGRLPAYFVAKQEGRVVGYSGLEGVALPDAITNENSICFSGIYILNQARGCGAGRKFFELQKSLARRLGITGAWLCVWKLNEAAIKFHQQMGFKIVGSQEWSFEANSSRWVCDDWVMYQDL